MNEKTQYTRSYKTNEIILYISNTHDLYKWGQKLVQKYYGKKDLDFGNIQFTVDTLNFMNVAITEYIAEIKPEFTFNNIDIHYIHVAVVEWIKDEIRESKHFYSETFQKENQ